MPKNKIIISLATLVALLPVLGFSNTVEAFFQVVAGVGIILLMVWSNIDKRLSMRAKAATRRKKKVPTSAEETLDERSDDRRLEDRRQEPGTILDREEILTETQEKSE